MSEQHQEEVDRGLAMRVGVSCGEHGAQIELTAIAPMHATDFEIDLILDRVMRAAQRQKAIAERPLVEQELANKEREIEEQRIKLAELAAGFQERAKIREERRDESISKRAAEHNAAVIEHANSGRRGVFEPKGAFKSQMAAFDMQLEKLNEAARSDEAAYLAEKSQIELHIKSLAKVKTALSRRLDECNMLVPAGGGNGADGSGNL